MKKLILLVALAATTTVVSGCNGNRGVRSWMPSWCQGAASPCSSTTAYDPATPYVDGGYMVPPAGVSELPPPGPAFGN